MFVMFSVVTCSVPEEHLNNLPIWTVSSGQEHQTHFTCPSLLLQLDAFVVVWGFCCAGVTFNFSKHLPILGCGVRALQNLYVPEDKDRAQQQQGMVQLIKER
jgi:hypothetical protein